MKSLGADKICESTQYNRLALADSDIESVPFILNEFMFNNTPAQKYVGCQTNGTSIYSEYWFKLISIWKDHCV